MTSLADGRWLLAVDSRPRSVILSSEACPEERERRRDGEGSQITYLEILRFAQNDVATTSANGVRPTANELCCSPSS